MNNDYLMELAEFICLMENPSLIDVASALYVYIMIALILYALLRIIITLDKTEEYRTNPKNKSECRQAIAYWQEKLARARARVYDSANDGHAPASEKRQRRERFRRIKASDIAYAQSKIVRLRAMMPELPDKDGNEQTITTINY